MQDFPANSAKARARTEHPEMERPERIERITTAEAERRKKTLGQKFKYTFFGSDNRGVLEYVVNDVVVPAVRDLIFDALQSGLERKIYGESRIRRGSAPSSYPTNTPHVNYQGMSSMGRSPVTGTRSLSRRSRAMHDFADVVISSRTEAEDVLEIMYEKLSRYGMVTVSEMYEMVGIRPEHTDTRWGWTSLRGAKIAKTRDGRWLLDLPEPEALA